MLTGHAELHTATAANQSNAWQQPRLAVHSNGSEHIRGRWLADMWPGSHESNHTHDARTYLSRVQSRANLCLITGKPLFDHGQTFDHERTFLCPRANFRFSTSKPWFVHEQTSSQTSEVDARSIPPQTGKIDYQVYTTPLL